MTDWDERIQETIWNFVSELQGTYEDVDMAVAEHICWFLIAIEELNGTEPEFMTMARFFYSWETYHGRKV